MMRLGPLFRRVARVAFLLPLILRSCTGVPAYAQYSGSANGALRVAADPNNLPFSNDRLEGFENRLAELIANELHTRVEYVWRAQRRGFFREMLADGRCDVVLGVPAGFDRALTTKPYYRSTYVFVTRRDRHLNLNSLDDRRLPRLKIGVPLVGDDGANPPPAEALARRGIITGVRGYSLYGDYRLHDPPTRVLADVASGAIDAAIVWGPLGGWYARTSKPRLRVAAVTPTVDAGVPFTFAIAIAVRRDRPKLRDAIDAVLTTRRKEIARLLDDYNVPRVAEPVAQRTEP